MKNLGLNFTALHDPVVSSAVHSLGLFVELRSGVVYDQFFLDKTPK